MGHAWLGLLLLCATLVAYLPAIRGGLLWDDNAHVTRADLQSLLGLWRIWFQLGATQQYYPLLHSAFWVEHRLWGDATVGYHLVNVVLHAAAACLFALVLHRLSMRGAWLGAFIFALHPVCVESVAWISEQKNTLSTVFYLSAMLVYLRHDEESNGGTREALPGRWQRNRARTRFLRLTPHYFVALALFIAALLSKSVTATLPAALLVVIWWRRGRLSWKEDVLPLAPWFALGMAAGLFTAWVERRFVGAEGVEFTLSAVERFLVAGRVVWFYLGKLLWPANLMFIYPRWDVSGAVWWQYLYPAGILALVAAAWMIRGRTRGPLAVLLFYVGSLFPALGFFNAYPFIYSFVADHFQYVASLGVIALVAAGYGKWPTAAAAAAICVLGTLTWLECRIYRDSETLYRTTLARNPGCWMAYNNLGFVVQGDGRVSEASALYQQALRIKPDYVEAHSNLGTVFYTEGRLAEAIAQFEEALRLRPNYAEARNNLGNSLVAANRLPEAISQFEEALRLKPSYPEADLNLGSALFRVHRLPEATTSIKEALRLKPDYAEAHDALGVVWYNSGRLPEAIAQFEEAVHLKPDYGAAHRDLSAALWASGRSAEAIAELEAALRLAPDDTEAASALGSAYYMAGRFPEAAARYEEVLRLKPGQADAHNSLGLALQSLHRPEEALAQFREAIRLSPDYAEAHYNLGLSLTAFGRREEAMAEFKAAVRYKPDYAEAHDHLGAVFYAAGRFAEAVAEFTETVRLKPDLAGARNNLELARRAVGSAGQAKGPRR